MHLAKICPRVLLVLGLATGFSSATRADDAASPPNSERSTRAAIHRTPSHSTGGPQIITIIESQSYHPGHDMDLEWQAVATGMGHIAVIAPQATLDDVTNLAATDILVVSSGVIDLPAHRVETILEFLQSGRAVYLQGEYLCNYSTNLAFETIVSRFGGSFTGTGTAPGFLEPMNVLGVFSYDPNTVRTIDGFWFGCAGSGNSTITPFLEYQGQNFGFVFTPPSPDYGKVVFDTDQDWVREADFRPTSGALMENILNYLAQRVVPVGRMTWGGVKSMYR